MTATLCLLACFAMSGPVIASSADITDISDAAVSLVYPPPPPEYDSPDQLWNYQIGAGVNSTPLIAGGLLYVGSDDSHLYALDAASGTLLWRYAIGGVGYSSPAVAGGVVYVGSNDGYVYALRPPQ